MKEADKQHASAMTGRDGEPTDQRRAACSPKSAPNREEQHSSIGRPGGRSERLCPSGSNRIGRGAGGERADLISAGAGAALTAASSNCLTRAARRSGIGPAMASYSALRLRPMASRQARLFSKSLSHPLGTDHTAQNLICCCKNDAASAKVPPYRAYCACWYADS